VKVFEAKKNPKLTGNLCDGETANAIVTREKYGVNEKAGDFFSLLWKMS
jgi:hypothetical protein